MRVGRVDGEGEEAEAEREEGRERLFNVSSKKPLLAEKRSLFRR